MVSQVLTVGIPRANQLALNAMKFSPWNSPNGVVHEGKGNTCEWSRYNNKTCEDIDPLDPWNPEYKAPLRGIFSPL